MFGEWFAGGQLQGQRRGAGERNSEGFQQQGGEPHELIGPAEGFDKIEDNVGLEFQQALPSGSEVQCAGQPSDAMAQSQQTGFDC